MFWPFLAPAMRRIALPYIPASGEQVANVVKALKLRPRLQGARMVDVGSGDGRLVVAAAKVCGLYVSMVGWVGGG
jgi:predicted RNA methylase